MYLKILLILCLFLNISTIATAGEWKRSWEEDGSKFGWRELKKEKPDITIEELEDRIEQLENRVEELEGKIESLEQ